MYAIISFLFTTALPQQNMGKHKKKSHSPLSFNHNFSFFHHHSPKSSPKSPHSTPDMKQQCLDKNKNKKTCNKYELQGIDNMIMINTGNDINNVDGDDTSCNTVNTQGTDTVVNVLNGDIKHDWICNIRDLIILIENRTPWHYPIPINNVWIFAEYKMLIVGKFVIDGDASNHSLGEIYILFVVVVFNGLRWEVVVRFVDIGEIVNHANSCFL